MAGKLSTAAIILCLSLVATAQAQTTVTVKNTLGIPQAKVRVTPLCQPAGYWSVGEKITNAEGQIDYPVMCPGQVKAERIFDRQDIQWFKTPAQLFDVSNPVPASLTLTIPALAVPFEPQLSARERGVIGLINDERKAQGIAPLYISTTLTAAADGYLHYIYDTSAIPPDRVNGRHYVIGSPSSRAYDSGMAGGNGASENLWAGRVSAVQVFLGWYNSPGHKANMLNPKYNAVGVGNREDKWVLPLMSIDPPGHPRDGLTTDIGDSSLADDEESEGAGSEKHERRSSGYCRKSAKLSFTKRRVRGRWLTVQLQLAVGARQQGTVRLTAWRYTRRGIRHRRLNLNRQLRRRVKLAPGYWFLSANFKPQRGSKYCFERRRHAVRVR